MPRRGIKNRNEWRQNNRNYDEHDDRDRKPTQRRVSFKPSASGGGGRHSGGSGGNIGNFKGGRTVELAVRTIMHEDDDNMGDSVSERPFTKFYHNRRKGSPIPRGKLMSAKRLQSSTFGWYQVTVPFGQKFQRDEITRLLLNAISPDIFIPHYWKQEKTCIMFYVDDLKIAERLQQADRTIQMPDGFIIQVKVRCGIPAVNVDETFKEKMKFVMAKRYNSATKALDLSKFHADPDFKDTFCALFRPNVMSAAIDIITTNIPDLVALNLNDNQLQHFDSLRNISKKIPHLKVLYMADNSINSVGSLSVFRDSLIEELILTNNSIATRYKDYSQYVSEIRRKFPKLVKFNGQILERQIVFDVSEDIALPEPKASFFCSPESVDIIREFLKQYFIIFDSDNRQPLLDAYHAQAMLSLAIPANQGPKLSHYWPNNRNLLRTHDADLKYRLLKCGRLPAVSLLSELPKTEHDLMSFSVDVTVFTMNFISFTVAGLFKEINSAASSSNSHSELRSFQRHIVIVPGVNGGFCIKNEMIVITLPTPNQIRAAFKPPITIAPAPVPTSIQQRIQSEQAIASTSQQLQLPINDTIKLQMVQAMSAQSHMNLDWSKKCLEETNWDFQHAAFVFEKLHKENKIPPEAFAK